LIDYPLVGNAILACLSNPGILGLSKLNPGIPGLISKLDSEPWAAGVWAPETGV